jgi:hypothetical protein
MKWAIGFVVFSITIGAPAVCRTSTGDQSFKALLQVVVVKPNILTVLGQCVAEREGWFRYQLVAEKTGRSGTAKSRQAGQFNLKIGVRAELCNLKFTISPEDRFHFSLKIFSGETVVAETEREFHAI